MLIDKLPDFLFSKNTQNVPQIADSVFLLPILAA